MHRQIEGENSVPIRKNQPPLDRLDSHARRLFFETLHSERKPIAFVGSGTSVAYGGISWQKSVEIVLAEAQKCLQHLVVELSRYKLRPLLEAVNTYLLPGALKSPSDKYGALDICEEALNHVDKLSASERGGLALFFQVGDGPATRQENSFRRFMATLYKDDTYLIRHTLAHIFCVNSEEQTPIELPILGAYKEKRKKCSDFLINASAEEIQRLAHTIYSNSFLGTLSTKAQAQLLREAYGVVEKEAAPIIAENGNSDTDCLPIDRRYLLHVFISEFNPAARIDILYKLALECRQKRPTLSVMQLHAYRPTLDPLRALQTWFGIQRYVTLNFDYELENNLILDDIRAIKARPHGFEEEQQRDPESLGVLERAPSYGDQNRRAADTSGWTRRFRDGMEASTDIYDERSVARLFDFALGSLDHSARIVHLHGRADIPQSMLLTEADSNRQYRRNRIARTALEQALDVMLLGNPVLFVGIGLSEPEITRALHELVSRGQANAFNPVFAIFNAKDPGTATWRQQIARYRQHAIHVIFAGHPRGAGSKSYVNAHALISDLKKYLKGPSDDPDFSEKLRRRIDKFTCQPDWIPQLKCDVKIFELISKQILKNAAPSTSQKSSLTEYLDGLENRLATAALIDCLKELRDGNDAYVKSFRLRHPALPAFSGPLQSDIKDAKPLRALRDQIIWTDGIKDRHLAVNNKNKILAPYSQLANRLADRKSPLLMCHAPLGAGKGKLAQELSEVFKQRSTKSLFVNCNFAIEFGSAVLLILRFVVEQLSPAGNTAQPNFSDLNELAQHVRSLIGKEGSPDFPLSNQIVTLKNKIASIGHRPQTKGTIVLLGIERLVSESGQLLSYEFDLLLGILFSRTFYHSGFCCIFLGTKHSYRLLRQKAHELGVRIDKVDWEFTDAQPSGFLGHLLTCATEKCIDPGFKKIHPRREWLHAQLQDIRTSASTEALTISSPRSQASKNALRLV